MVTFRRTRRISGGAPLLVALGALVPFAPPLAGQLENARPLVVRVNAFEAASAENPSGGSVPTYGSGIVIGAPTEDSVLIATARHVVEGSGRVDVYFSFAETVRHDGTVLWEHGELDIAVIGVLTSEAFVDSVTTSFDRLGRPENLSNGSPVYPLGCPDGECWQPPGTPDQVLSYSPPLVLDFQSTFVAGGSSGGGLFDQYWEVVGMVLRNDLPRALAMPIDEVLREIQDPTSGLPRADWNDLQMLRAPSVPRSGYGWTVGASVLYGLAPPAIQGPGGIDLSSTLDTRFPSLRVTLANGNRRWHVGGLRLAPSNVSITAAIAGLSVEWRSTSGHFLGRAFAEGAAGRVESRYDVGGYYVGTADEYVPVWEREERDGLGFGGGVMVELILFRNLIFEGTLGGWSFGMPENAPDVPYFYAGGGLRLGW